MALINKLFKTRMDGKGVASVPWAVTLSGKPSLKISGTLGVRVQDRGRFKQGARAGQKHFQDALNGSISAGFRHAGATSGDVNLLLDGAALETRLVLKQRLAKMGLELVDFLVLSAQANNRKS